MAPRGDRPHKRILEGGARGFNRSTLEPFAGPAIVDLAGAVKQSYVVERILGGKGPRRLRQRGPASVLQDASMFAWSAVMLLKDTPPPSAAERREWEPLLDEADAVLDRIREVTEQMDDRPPEDYPDAVRHVDRIRALDPVGDHRQGGHYDAVTEYMVSSPRGRMRNALDTYAGMLAGVRKMLD